MPAPSFGCTDGRRTLARSRCALLRFAWISAMDGLTAQRCLQAAQRDAKQYREDAAAVARALPEAIAVPLAQVCARAASADGGPLRYRSRRGCGKA
jgi:hypothetical protein